MPTPKDILVVTTSSIEGLKIKKYLKPVSAHIVAGTNLFSDFLGGLSDVFGGRSQSYQNQLTALYNEAIDRIKTAAYEIGGTCVLGLNIDMDEISGKGKSMFMLSAVGTAVILEKEIVETRQIHEPDETFENVSVERVNTLRTKKAILEKAAEGTLPLGDDIWAFITTNRIDEIFPYLLDKFSKAFVADNTTFGSSEAFYKNLITYIDALPEDKKVDLLYNAIAKVEDGNVVTKISAIIQELNLLDWQKVTDLLNHKDFRIQKRALRIVTYDKPFFNREDINQLQAVSENIKVIFIERGKRVMKKQLLSSKEKELWVCECGKTNDIESCCSGCDNDIFGFRFNELKPWDIEKHIEQKIELIGEYLE